jgi:leucyl-tRNA synthetase
MKCGKKRGEITFPAGTNPKDIEATVVDLDVVKKWLDGGNIKKVIVVPGRMINVVI